MKRTFAAFVAMALIGALAIAGCGSDNSSSGGGYGDRGGSAPEAASTELSSGTEAAVVSAAGAPQLGLIIVDSKGFTLYDFHKDKGTTPACYEACAKAWPPLTTRGAPEAGEGAMASQLGTTKRKDGTTQVTYAGHPLYTYTADAKPGDTKGNDIDAFGAEWYALQPNGEEP